MKSNGNRLYFFKDGIGTAIAKEKVAWLLDEKNYVEDVDCLCGWTSGEFEKLFGFTIRKDSQYSILKSKLIGVFKKVKKEGMYTLKYEEYEHEICIYDIKDDKCISFCISGFNKAIGLKMRKGSVLYFYPKDVKKNLVLLERKRIWYKKKRQECEQRKSSVSIDGSW